MSSKLLIFVICFCLLILNMIGTLYKDGEPSYRVVGFDVLPHSIDKMKGTRCGKNTVWYEYNLI